jgi:NitT/TauT family transport system ATP-binding protein
MPEMPDSVAAEKHAILEMRRVSKSFARPSGEPLVALAEISLALREGEILGLLGRSGSGKSTLLRLAAGLLEPTSGEALYRGHPLAGPEEGIAVVFQTFALLPWLTVLENVELGLDALGVSRAEATRRASSAIDLIGLDGFQSAYPRELSGGTHNIEEAVVMCDRVLVLSSNPSRIAAEIPVPLAHPRNRQDAQFNELVDRFYSLVTSRPPDPAHTQAHAGISQALPPVGPHLMTAVIEAVAEPPYDGQADLADLARMPALESRDLFAVAEALRMLEFAELKEGALELTAAGRVFAQSGYEERKGLFKEHLLRFVPFVGHIQRVLEEREGRSASRVRFKSELEDHLSPQDAERTLRTAIGWGRYAEVLTYDDHRREFTTNHYAG